MDGETRRLDVPLTAAGTRLDHFLTAQISDRSRSVLKRLIVDGLVLVDDAPAAKPGMLLKSGSSVEVTLPNAVPVPPQAEQIAFETIFEDEDLIVVDKPAGLVVQIRSRLRARACEHRPSVRRSSGRWPPVAPRATRAKDPRGSRCPRRCYGSPLQWLPQ